MNLDKIAVLGLARSGIAAANKIKSLGGNAFLSELKPASEVPGSKQLQRDFECEFGKHSSRIFENNTIIVSPGIPQTAPILQQARKRGIELISEIEFGYRIKSKDSNIIAVTGSNGKSTTVSLITEILKHAGYSTQLGGNIGTAFTALSIEKQGIDFIVLEISSFQLEHIREFHAQTAILLNLTPDHLNRYRDFRHYADTKFRIFANQTSHDLAIINHDDHVIEETNFEFKASVMKFSLEKESSAWFDGQDLHLNEYSIPVESLLLKGPHNYANCLAALLSIADLNIDSNLLTYSLSNFKSLEHRLEFVDKINNITFINDSKATNTDSVKYALQSFPLPIRIIMGGQGKGENYAVLNDMISKNAEKVYLIGESGLEMEKTYRNLVKTELFSNLESAVITAYREAEQGDYIVLSPACASFDMFANFEERGNVFKNIVQSLR